MRSYAELCGTCGNEGLEMDATKGPSEIRAYDDHSKRRTILLAEDDYMGRDCIKIGLEIYGLNVITAVDGEDAVAKYRKFQDRIDMVVMDVAMPRLNGMEAYDRMRKMNGGVKVLLISGYAGDIFSLSETKEKNVAFLEKPFRIEALMSKVYDILCV